MVAKHIDAHWVLAVLARLVKDLREYGRLKVKERNVSFSFCNFNGVNESRAKNIIKKATEESV
jgi:hypothetical protein